MKSSIAQALRDDSRLAIAHKDRSLVFGHVHKSSLRAQLARDRGRLLPTRQGDVRSTPQGETQSPGVAFVPAQSPVANQMVGRLQQRTQRGDCAAYWEDFAPLLRDINEGDVEALAADPRITIETLGGQKLVYLAHLHEAEVGLARVLRQMLGQTGGLLPRGLDPTARLAGVAGISGVTLNPSQQEAAIRTLSHRLCIISGGPGTGKTTMTRAILDALPGNVRVTLCAPTGRAARRLADATGRDATTIHRLIYSSAEIPTDVVCVDEASMVDVVMAYELVKRLPAHAGLIFIGDVDQLPSVGPGQVFADLLSSGRVPAALLSVPQRQNVDSGIHINATRINQGDIPSTDREKPDFVLVQETQPDLVAERIVKLSSVLIPEKMGLNPMRDVQVLTPQRAGPLGTRALNQLLQQALNPEGFSVPWTSFLIGDRVMLIENDHSRGVYNGDVGFVVELDETRKKVRVQFDHTSLLYARTDLRCLTLAYATTIHKSQGSEYPVVIIPVPGNGRKSISRRLLYTGVTRGKRKVIVIGGGDAVSAAVSNVRDRDRVSGLMHRL